MGMKGTIDFSSVDGFDTYLLGLPGVKQLVVDGSTRIIYVNSDCIIPIMLHIKLNQELKFTALLDIWASDNLGKDKRFEVNYMVLSVYLSFRVIIRTEITEGEGLQTVTNLFSSAGWLEREVWDMFGILFFGNTDLRRILTDYGFEGHPLRKDFPVSGFVEVRYDDGCKRVVYEPIEVAQEYRSFQFTNPWKKENE